MKTPLIRKTTSFLTTSAIILSSFSLLSDHPNFSGEWLLNEPKSELGEFGKNIAAINIKVVQKEDTITISKTGRRGKTDTEILSYDGKESVIPINTLGIGTRKSTGKWSEDGQAFIISFIIDVENNGQKTIINGIQTWTMKENELYIETSYSSTAGDFKTKCFYDKQ
jgi:dipeptidyl aminopeptidase/acylaminoacyl peptidase